MREEVNTYYIDYIIKTLYTHIILFYYFIKTTNKSVEYIFIIDRDNKFLYYDDYNK